jgi:hypothetical protein
LALLFSNLDGQKLYDFKGTNVYRLSGQLVGTGFRSNSQRKWAAKTTPPCKERGGWGRTQGYEATLKAEIARAGEAADPDFQFFPESKYRASGWVAR